MRFIIRFPSAFRIQVAFDITLIVQRCLSLHNLCPSFQRTRQSPRHIRNSRKSLLACHASRTRGNEQFNREPCNPLGAYFHACRSESNLPDPRNWYRRKHPCSSTSNLHRHGPTAQSSGLLVPHSAELDVAQPRLRMWPEHRLTAMQISPMISPQVGNAALLHACV